MGLFQLEIQKKWIKSEVKYPQVTFRKNYCCLSCYILCWFLGIVIVKTTNSLLKNGQDLYRGPWLETDSQMRTGLKTCLFISMCN